MPNLWKKMKNHNSVFSSFPAISYHLFGHYKKIFFLQGSRCHELAQVRLCLARVEEEGFFEIIAGPLCQMETML